MVSAFGLSKLIGNIPSGYFVEKYGRKPSMMVGLGMCGVGLGSIGKHSSCEIIVYGCVLERSFNVMSDIRCFCFLSLFSFLNGHLVFVIIMVGLALLPGFGTPWLIACR